MEITSRSSRRAFVIGGTAAAACIGPVAMAELGRTAATGGADDPTRPVAAPTEVGEWEALIGASFLVAGAAGKALAKLAAVERPAMDPERPVGLARFQPFTAYLEMDSRQAPAGQRTYRVLHPTRGATDLFLSRGTDMRGKAVLLALFN